MPGHKGLVASAVVVLCLAAYFPFVPARFADFRAFYCSGRAVLEHADPYREHPLRDCERTVQAPGISRLRDDVAIPAPFPGYVLAFFALFALLPFGVAAAVWLTALLAALGVSIALGARCLQLRVAAVAIVVGFPTVAAAIRIGQATPFVALAMVVAAFLLTREKPRSAAVCALAITLEPHVAPAILAALFIGERRTRIPLAIGTVALGALSLVVLGLPLNVEYLRFVLPEHALANLPDLAQFSAAHFAYIAGMAPADARLLGSGWYAIASLIGVGVAIKLRACYGVAALVFIPPAFELFGGLHVHVTQLGLAVPGFLLLLKHSGRLYPVLVAAVFFAALPWSMIVNFPMLVPAISVLGIAFAVALGVDGLAIPLALTAAALTLGLFVTSFSGGTGHAPLPIAVHPAGNPLADTSWGVLMVVRDGFAPVGWFVAAKVPTLAAFAVLLATLCVEALNAARADLVSAGLGRTCKVPAHPADT